VQREDDTPAAIAKRLAAYEANTAPLIEWYRERQLMAVVDGDGTADQVTERLLEAIDDRRRGG
jgi:adenylate kinase